MFERGENGWKIFFFFIPVRRISWKCFAAMADCLPLLYIYLHGVKGRRSYLYIQKKICSEKNISLFAVVLDFTPHKERKPHQPSRRRKKMMIVIIVVMCERIWKQKKKIEIFIYSHIIKFIRIHCVVYKYEMPLNNF